MRNILKFNKIRLKTSDMNERVMRNGVSETADADYMN